MKSLEFDKLLSADACPADRYDYLRRQSPDGRVYVQEKKNGVGVRVRFVDGRLSCFTTRHHKLYDAGYFSALNIDWTPLADTIKTGSCHAEIYSIDNAVQLATLAGAVSVNRGAFDVALLPMLRFYIYDYSIDICQPFSLRQRNLHRLSMQVCPLVEIAPTITIDTTDGLLAHWRAEVTNNGRPPEGFIYRVDPCFHHDGGATYMQVKRTVLHTAEGTCIGVEEGIGKRTGMLGSFRLQLASGHVVSVGGGDGLTDAELTKYLKNPPIGLPVTFSYKELSKAGIPLRVQFVSVRDYE